jgi:diguanylate cyclase (GGDEF)-like protein
LILVLVDIDHFKNVHDSYGRHSDEPVLAQTSELFNNCLEYYGAQEFVIIIDKLSIEASLFLFAEFRIRIAQNVFTIPDGNLSVTISFGLGNY